MRSLPRTTAPSATSARSGGDSASLRTANRHVERTGHADDLDLLSVAARALERIPMQRKQRLDDDR